MNKLKDVLWAALFVLAATPSWAAYSYGSDTGIDKFFDGGMGFMIRTVGTGVLGWGLVTAWLKMMSPNKDEDMSIVFKRVAAGAGIFLTREIVDLIKNLTGFRG